MTRSWMFLFFAFASATLGQSTCPAINFAGPQKIDLRPSTSSHTDLIRQPDGSWTAFEVNDLDPGFVVGTTPHFENQIGLCLPQGQLKSGSAPLAAPPLLPTSYVAAPALVAPGKIFEFIGAPGTSIPFNILDSQHTIISTGALHLTTTQVMNIFRVGIAEATGDGRLDVVAIGYPLGGSDVSLWIFPGNGDGTFGSGIQQTLPSAVLMTNFDIADVDGDGIPDVVFVDVAHQSLIIASGPAGSRFNVQTTPLPVIQGISFDTGFRIADLNGDNHPDLVLGGWDPIFNGRVVVLPGDGKGGFSAPTASGPLGCVGCLGVGNLAIGDLNGDGIPDIATQTGAVLFGDGKGGFSAFDRYAVSYTSQVTIADVNSDGIPDLVFGGGTADFVTGSPGFVTVLFGLGSGKFTDVPVTDIGLKKDPGSTDSRELVAGDFDADGRSEVAAFDAVSSADQSGEVVLTVMKAAADGRLSMVAQSSSPHPAGYQELTALSGDFNHDGRQDLLLLLRPDSGGSEILFYRGRGDNTFDAPVRTLLAEPADFMIATDLNGDGIPDLAGTAGNLVWIRAGVGDGTFGPMTFSFTPASPNGPPAIAFGDFTHDGKQDFAVASTDGNLTVLPGKGDGSFGTPVISTIPGGFEPTYQNGLATADMNGDGLLDLILQTVPGTITVMLGYGDGTFQARNAGVYGAPVIASLAVADLNRDGAADLIGNFPYRGSLGSYTFLPGAGDGSFQPAIQGPPGGLLIIADVNGDGFPDLIESSGNDMDVLLNISVPRAALTVVSGASLTPGPLAAGAFASAFGQHLSSATLSANPAVPSLGSVTVSVQDATGVARAALLTYVSPEQINFIVPGGTAAGPATVILNSSSQSAPARAGVTVNAMAPALFTVPGFYSKASNSFVSVAAAYAIRVDPEGNQTYLSLFNSAGVLSPIDVTQPGSVYVALFGTGFDGAGAAIAAASIEGVPARVTYAGPAPGIPGVDQINLLLPASLAGKGIVFVSFAVQGLVANRVTLPIL